MPLHALTPASDLAQRQAAIAAAFRAARREPRPVAVTPKRDDEVATLRAEMRRLVERVERIEDKVDLIRDGDEAPLAWPVAVDSDNRLEVPPLEVSRKSSPAFDILLGPARRDSA